MAEGRSELYEESRTINLTQVPQLDVQVSYRFLILSSAGISEYAGDRVLAVDFARCYEADEEAKGGKRNERRLRNWVNISPVSCPSGVSISLRRHTLDSIPSGRTHRAKHGRYAVKLADDCPLGAETNNEAGKRDSRGGGVLCFSYHTDYPLIAVLSFLVILIRRRVGLPHPLPYNVRGLVPLVMALQGEEFVQVLKAMNLGVVYTVLLCSHALIRYHQLRTPLIL